MTASGNYCSLIGLSYLYTELNIISLLTLGSFCLLLIAVDISNLIQLTLKSNIKLYFLRMFI